MLLCSSDVKKKMITNVMNKKRLDVLDLSETKLKGNGSFKWLEINGIRSLSLRPIELRKV